MSLYNDLRYWKIADEGGSYDHSFSVNAHIGGILLYGVLNIMTLGTNLLFGNLLDLVN